MPVTTSFPERDSLIFLQRETDDQVLIYPFLNGTESPGLIAASGYIEVLKMPGDPAHGQIRITCELGVMDPVKWPRLRAAMEMAFEISDGVKRRQGLKIRETICKECPFRRNAAPGWLGLNTPEDFAQQALSDDSVPCHLMLNHDASEGDGQSQEALVPRCLGAIKMMRNKCKLPRNLANAQAVSRVSQDHATVFSNEREFIEYHNAADVKSWEVAAESKR